MAAFSPHDLLLQLQNLDAFLNNSSPSEQLSLDFTAPIPNSDSTLDKSQAKSQWPLLERFTHASYSADIWNSNLLTHYEQAYKATLAGRIYTHDADSPYRLPPALIEIDRILSTSHAPRFKALASSVKPFPFMELPTEIRLMVYDYLFDAPAAFCMQHRFREAYAAYSPPRRNLRGIFCTSSQVRLEAISTLYTRRPVMLILDMPQINNKFMLREEMVALARRLRGLPRHFVTRLDIVISLSTPLAPSAIGKHARSFNPQDLSYQPYSLATYVLSILPNLDEVVLSFPGIDGTEHGELPRRTIFKGLLGDIAHAKPPVKVHWDTSTVEDDILMADLTEVMTSVGGDSLHFKKSAYQLNHPQW